MASTKELHPVSREVPSLSVYFGTPGTTGMIVWLADDPGEQQTPITLETNNLMKVLMILTSHGELGDTGKKTGFWVEEFAAPYYELADAGAEITLASPKGGQPPIDPKSEEAEAQTRFTHRFDQDEPLKQKLAHTLKLSSVKAADYDAVFYPGGHGPLWDLVKDPKSIALIEAFQQQGKPMALVCHAPCALLKVKLPNGDALIKGKTVTGFSDTEEAAVKLAEVVPFLLEDELRKAGAHYSKGSDWGVHVQTDGLLITGQNPASSAEAAKALLKLLPKKSRG